jgi:excisionase family DNA binding protein
MAHRWLTPSEAAKYLNLTPDAVRNMERHGKIRATKTESGRRLFSWPEVLRVQRERARGKSQS